jgi:hypothetical protein
MDWVGRKVGNIELRCVVVAAGADADTIRAEEDRSADRANGILERIIADEKANIQSMSRFRWDDEKIAWLRNGVACDGSRNLELIISCANDG